jgi:hypothetical protein
MKEAVMATQAPVVPRPPSSEEVHAKAPDYTKNALKDAVERRRNRKGAAGEMWLWPLMILVSLPIASLVIPFPNSRLATRNSTAREQPGERSEHDRAAPAEDGDG